MKKYFLYELKKHIWTLVILTAVCALPYIVELATLRMLYTYNYEGAERIVLRSPQLSYVFVELLILLFVVPAIVYSFKMSKRGVDGHYSLPLKREKLYLVATMVGLILVLVPFTISYWGGFFTLLFRKGNPYHMGYYIPAYLGGLFFAVLLFGINAFIYTRANRVVDGIVFMGAYAFIGFLAINFLDYAFDVSLSSWKIEECFIFSGSMFAFVNRMTDYILGNKLGESLAAWWFGLTAAAGVLCYVLFYFAIRFEKGENAEENSTSWFGYKTLIPVYILLCLGGGAGEEIIGLALVAVGGVVATIVYKRKFKLKFIDWLPLIIGLAAGIVLALVTG